MTNVNRAGILISHWYTIRYVDITGDFKCYFSY